MNRRQILVAAGTVGIAGLAGCAAGEDGVYEATAEPAAVPDDVVASVGYQSEGPDPFEIDETIEALGVSQEVKVTTWTASYSADERVLIVLSTPDVSVAGQSLNPLARLSGADLISRLLDESLNRLGDGEASLRDIESAGETPVTVLGEEAAVEEFTAVLETEGTVDVDGEQVETEGTPVRIYLLSVTHEDDVVFAVGFHPQHVDAGEELYELIEAIEH